MPQQIDNITARHLAKVVESSDDAIISKDLNSIIISWNSAAERMFGYTAAEAVGKSIRMIIPPDRQSEEDTVLARIRSGEPIDHYETIRMRKDGVLFPISLTVSPIYDDSGTVIGASKIARDISETTRLAQENARLFAEAQDANRMKDDFLAVLSHELRTPLNAIVGYSRLLRGGLMPATEVQRAFETLERNANSLTRIVEDVLDVSRIVSGKIRLNVQAVELAVVVDNAVTTMQPAADAKGVRLQTLVDPRVGPISGDPDRLQQVVWNLVSNAVKFTPKGGRVQVVLERINSYVELVVSDTGVGITPEFLPHVFDRFRQADSGPTRKSGGLGLGLAIVRHLVELHGGSVHADSGGADKGATFTLRFPLMVIKRDAAEPRREHPLVEQLIPLTSLADLRGVRVMAVDDEPDALGLMRLVLETAGAEVITESSPLTALATIATVKPHVLVVDLGMPEIDGYDFITRLRASTDAGVRDIPAAALTAFARTEDRTRALQSGFEMHLAKPVDPAELVASVATLVRRSRSQSGP
jgi:PAS domain S-box-containing protein